LSLELLSIDGSYMKHSEEPFPRGKFKRRTYSEGTQTATECKFPRVDYWTDDVHRVQTSGLWRTSAREPKLYLCPPFSMASISSKLSHLLIKNHLFLYSHSKQRTLENTGYSGTKVMFIVCSALEFSLL